MSHLHSFISALCLGTFVVTAAAQAPAAFKVGEFEFARPEGWETVPTTSPFRQAELRVSKNGETAEVIFFYFGAGQGGDAKANVERWLGQFREPREQLKPEVQEKTINGRKITYVYGQGTYMSGPPAGARVPLKDHALLGAVLESRQGNVFVRMTGPIQLVKDQRAAFEKLIERAAEKD
jgi:hypothetical protein